MSDGDWLGLRGAEKEGDETEEERSPHSPPALSATQYNGWLILKSDASTQWIASTAHGNVEDAR